MTTIASSIGTSRTPAVEFATGTGTGRKALWAGRILSGLAVLFLGFDAVFKLTSADAAASASAQLGWSASAILQLGIIELVCLVVYLVPRTAILGAVLWTGYLGGAVATHLRVGDPLPTHTLFPLYVAALLWGGLWLRDRRVRALIAAT
jgi:hypothetical protein